MRERTVAGPLPGLLEGARWQFCGAIKTLACRRRYWRRNELIQGAESADSPRPSAIPLLTMPENPEADSSEQPAPFVPPTPEALEQLLPQYGISKLIAHGGMGAVYSGVQLDLDRPVAIKILPPDAARDKESIDRF